VAILAKGDLLIGDFVLSKRAADLSPRYTMVATDPRRLLSERIEAAMSADALSVALAQPHRNGNSGRNAGDALALFCARLRPECLAAGRQYDRVVRAEKSARGFHVVDQAPGEGEQLDEDEQAAKDEAAILAFGASNAVLTDIMPGLPLKMELLCYDKRAPSPYDEDKLMHGLLNLARHYGLLDEGINRDKPL
jgi:hypothetical protein